ncbi:DoxX family protein [Candidatus Marimicrobium litorale]|jgi:putative oxidoreductase|uniref:DoxX family protein n=1 Tax=Candidatus Marimicrobium litorale TaxID=2518991 RepID=A0ABT3T7G0_9GAMM|nr:DoxX family protein [Candidatus Marimicrobium litorale]MCX2978206.1 DoxX family protein [Candidatus Marimicrobium litorale]MDC0362054.1 DoxX family membrane protein [Halioglobus sp.]
MRYALITAGRVLLALYFLLPGIAKFVSWDMHVELMEAHNMVMVPALLAIAGIVQIGGSVCLLLNKQVVVCALGFAVMILLINLNLHDFWNVYEGVDAKHETQNFVKNLGIFAGLLLLAAVDMEKTNAH